MHPKWSHYAHTHHYVQGGKIKKETANTLIASFESRDSLISGFEQ